MSYIKNVIDSLKESCKWRTQLLLNVLFRSSKDINEKPYKHLWVITKKL